MLRVNYYAKIRIEQRANNFACGAEAKWSGAVAKVFVVSQKLYNEVPMKKTGLINMNCSYF